MLICSHWGFFFAFFYYLYRKYFFIWKIYLSLQSKTETINLKQTK